MVRGLVLECEAEGGGREQGRGFGFFCWFFGFGWFVECRCARGFFFVFFPHDANKHSHEIGSGSA